MDASRPRPVHVIRPRALAVQALHGAELAHDWGVHRA